MFQDQTRTFQILGLCKPRYIGFVLKIQPSALDEDLPLLVILMHCTCTSMNVEWAYLIYRRYLLWS